MQGPPGTGKSHTIANLICHLLAQGKRVLVTAQTTRALHVLHDLLPENIRPLCFNAAEQGRKEQEDLEQKIKDILVAEKNRQTAEGDHIQELEKRIQAKQEARKATGKRFWICVSKKLGSIRSAKDAILELRLRLPNSCAKRRLALLGLQIQSLLIRLCLGLHNKCCSCADICGQPTQEKRKTGWQGIASA